jgi:nucleoside-diphosphate-sugar epimerase
MQRLLIAGCGDIGTRLIAQLPPPWQPIALVRSDASAERWRQRGIEVIAHDLEQPLSASRLPEDLTALLILYPPGSSGSHDQRTRHLLAALDATPPARLIYLGTTGVYGDSQGAWIDEEAAIAATTPRAVRRRDAELQITAFATRHNRPWFGLRAGGIYGSGRLPLDRLRRGEPILGESESGYSNRIHVNDLVNIIATCLTSDAASGFYNVVDGQPGSMSGYFKAVAAHCGLAAPQEIPLSAAREQLSAAMLEYLAESRRIRNDKLRQQLGYQLRYPDLASGLAACDCHPGRRE